GPPDARGDRDRREVRRPAGERADGARRRAALARGARRARRQARERRRRARACGARCLPPRRARDARARHVRLRRFRGEHARDLGPLAQVPATPVDRSASGRAAVLLRAARSDEIEKLSAIAFRAKAHWGYAPELLDLWRDDLTYTAANLAEDDVV